MTRAEAERILASQGVYNPSIYGIGQGVTQSDILRAQNQNQGVAPYVPLIAQGVAEAIKPPSTQELLNQMILQRMEREQQSQAPQGQINPVNTAATVGGLGGAAGMLGGASDFFGGIGDSIGGLFGGGEAASATTQVAQPASTLEGLMAAQAGGDAAMSTAPAAAGGMPTLGGMAATAAPLAAAAYGAYRANELFRDSNDMESGIRAGFRPANMLAFGLGGSPVLGLGMGAFNQAFGSSKGRDQVGRDEYRGALQDNGMLGQDYGMDVGGQRVSFASNQGLPYADYNVDFSKEGIGDVVGSVNPLAAILTGSTNKQQNDLAGQFTNAVSSTGNARQNAIDLYTNAGYDRNSAWNAVDKLDISDEEKNAFKAGIDSVFGVGNKK